ncbi:hypothetical protein SDC9_87072 [bioreactor metagenome]|uniref:Uncharacterized protein n=1 Tax=bioreactor metagenome TaxID=1076179 RepID=A0A644ZKN3_9ZZZZ
MQGGNGGLPFFQDVLKPRDISFAVVFKGLHRKTGSIGMPGETAPLFCGSDKLEASSGISSGAVADTIRGFKKNPGDFFPVHLHDPPEKPLPLFDIRQVDKAVPERCAAGSADSRRDGEKFPHFQNSQFVHALVHCLHGIPRPGESPGKGDGADDDACGKRKGDEDKDEGILDGQVSVRAHEKPLPGRETEEA